MKSFKAWTLLVYLLLAGTPAIQASETPAIQAFKTFGFIWENSYIPVYFNPAFMPESYADGDPRMKNDLSPEARKELQIQIFEEDIRRAAHTWSNEPGSTLVIAYHGRTNEPCGNPRTGTTRICLQPNYQHSALATTGIRGGKFAVGSEILVNANSITQAWTYLIVKHEIGHIAGLDHVERSVATAIMNHAPHLTMTPLYPADSAGVRHLYPFTEACAPVFDMEGGELGFWAEIYLDGFLYQVRFNYREPGGGYLEVVAAPLLDISSQERSCALKLDGNELFIPYIELEGQTYWLKLELNPVLPGEAITLDPVDYQPVPD